VSRLPRVQENLKAGFTAEAASAARFRAYALGAEKNGAPNLAKHWAELARQKDELAILQLEAAGRVRGGALDVEAELAEERYENDVLYPKLKSLSPEAAATFELVISAQRAHLERMEALRSSLASSPGDAPAVLGAAEAARR
jgi:rubrerythrin